MILLLSRLGGGIPARRIGFGGQERQDFVERVPDRVPGSPETPLLGPASELNLSVVVIHFLVNMYVCAYTMIEIRWDPEKAGANLAKHGIDFADAVAVFFDDLAVTIMDVQDEEERFVTIGTDALNRVLLVVYAWRGKGIRIISARRPTRFERKQYEDSP
jgi:uncharacterized DUF497 family protein